MECLDLGRLAALRVADFPEAVSATVQDENGKCGIYIFMFSENS